MHSVVSTEEETAYASAIRCLGEVMSVYATDNSYPIYGFGAKIPPTHSVVSNCFALTGDFFQPEVDGVEGMLKAYHRALRVCHLHGPSYLGDVVKLAGDMSRPYVQPRTLKMNEQPPDMKYYVLVVLTDGEIEDQEEVVRQVRNCLELPLSIIFVGIGVQADFKFLRELTKDIPEILKSVEAEDSWHSDLQERQLVHFIAFKDHADDPQYLTAATLSHLPMDIVKYYMGNGIKPRGLHRFEDKDGNPVPKYVPKEPLAAQTVPVKALRIPSSSTNQSREASKAVSAVGSLNNSGVPGTKSPRHSTNTPTGSRAGSHLPSRSKELRGQNDEEDPVPLIEEQDSDDDVRQDRKKPIYLEQEKARLINNGVNLGYEKFRIVRAIRDGLPSSALDVLVDNILNGGYGGSLSYKDASLQALSDADFLNLPGIRNGGKKTDELGEILDRSRVRKFRFGQDDDEEDIDYNLRLQQLAVSAKVLDKRLETRLGLVPSDRLAIKGPEDVRKTKSSKASSSLMQGSKSRMESSSKTRTLLELSASRMESHELEDDGQGRGATKTLEEAAGRLGKLSSSKGPTGNGPGPDGFQAISEEEELRATGIADPMDRPLDVESDTEFM